MRSHRARRVRGPRSGGGKVLATALAIAALALAPDATGQSLLVCEMSGASGTVGGTADLYLQIANDATVRSLQASVGLDRGLRVTAIDTDGCIPEVVGAVQFLPKIADDGSWFTLGVVIDYSDTSAGIPPSPDPPTGRNKIAHVQVAVDASPRPFYSVTRVAQDTSCGGDRSVTLEWPSDLRARPEDGYGTPPLRNVFVIGFNPATNYYPELREGIVGLAGQSFRVESRDTPCGTWTEAAVVSTSGTGTTSWTDSDPGFAEGVATIQERYWRVVRLDDSSPTENVVGIARVDVRPGRNFCAYPFRPVPEDRSLDGIVGCQLTGGLSSALADQVWIYVKNPLDPTLDYHAIAWRKSSDGLWYTGNLPTDIVLHEGMGFVVLLPPFRSAESFYLTGEVIESHQPLELLKGINLVGPGCLVPTPLESTGFCTSVTGGTILAQSDLLFRLVKGAAPADDYLLAIWCKTGTGIQPVSEASYEVGPTEGFRVVIQPFHEGKYWWVSCGACSE
ncbi:MAG: hypothetical protein JXP34_20635 [Planctomycetes bacterium]|nr:hypothetical protein [Planctomycetota bacterium]